MDPWVYFASTTIWISVIWQRRTFACRILWRRQILHSNVFHWLLTFRCFRARQARLWPVTVWHAVSVRRILPQQVYISVKKKKKKKKMFLFTFIFYVLMKMTEIMDLGFGHTIKKAPDTFVICPLRHPPSKCHRPKSENRFLIILLNVHINHFQWNLYPLF